MSREKEYECREGRLRFPGPVPFPSSPNLEVEHLEVAYLILPPATRIALYVQ